jgi:hypothetical protein
VDEVIALGLRRGELVRFRRDERKQWQLGRVYGINRDGSVAITDKKGASRAFPVDQVEVKRPGLRGAAKWLPLTDHAAKPEQLGLL